MLGGLPGRGVPPGYGGGYGNYPVLGLGTPSGLSYPNAQDAAQGWAGQLGFNIDPRGGLLLRPWEARSWQLSGIDPNLWNAPFAGGGLLGGGYPGGGYIQPGFPSPGPTIPPGWTPSLGGPVPPGGGTVPPGNENGKPEFASIAPFGDYNPDDPTQWHPPSQWSTAYTGFEINPHLPQDPFMQFTQHEHQRIQAENAAAAARAAAPPMVVNRPGEPVGPSQTYVSPPGPHRDEPVISAPVVPRTVSGNVPTVTPPFVPESRGPDIPVGMFMNPLTQMLEPIATAPGVGFKGSYAGMPAGLLGPR